MSRTALEQPHRGAGRRGDSGRQGGREDEGRRIAAHRVYEGGVARNIAAERAETLGECPFDDVDLRHHAGGLANASAARAIHADRMHLVNIGHGAIALRQGGDFRDGRDIAAHRIEALEDDELRAIAGLDQQFLEMREVIVAENLPLGARALHALDHRVVIGGVGEDQAVRKEIGDRRDRREIGNPSGGEDERRFLAVEIGELMLQFDDRAARAGDVARSPCARAHLLRGLDHCVDDLGMLAHAEIVVGAPDRDVLRAPVGAAPERLGESLHRALDMRKSAIAPLSLEAEQGPLEIAPIVHFRVL